jgi:antirestriction protein ArdC
MEKKSLKEQVKEITESLNDNIMNLFESDRFKNYLNVMSRFHNYSVNNSMLIMMQKPDATLVAGYNKWQKEFKRNVNRGEKAITILAPSPYTVTKKEIDENGEEVEKKVKLMGYRPVKVFDVSQTDGEPLPEIVQQMNFDVEDFAVYKETLEHISPVSIAYQPTGSDANGYYSHATNSIVVSDTLGEAQTIKTMIHEIAHAILHNKENGEEMDADRYTKEVEAESVAYTVCTHFGIDASDYSFGYIAGWSAGKELKELKSSMAVIQKTATEVIQSMEEEMEKLYDERTHDEDREESIEMA